MLKKLLYLLLLPALLLTACKEEEKPEPKPDPEGKETVVPTPPTPPAEEYNVFGKVSCAGEGVPGVLVSDGIEIVQTDAAGNYYLMSDKKWRYAFMIIPRGYTVPVKGILPQFSSPLVEDANTTEEKNFELIADDTEDYTLMVLGDMHLAKRTGDLVQFGKVATDLNKHIAAAPGKVYCLTLGDMTWDMYWVSNSFGFPEYLETMNKYFNGQPFFHTMGNHDNEMEKAGDFDKALRYTENIAPDYYSFNIGRIHYIVLDNMDFTGVESGEGNRSKYKKNFTAEELAWLKKDLSYVDKDTPIFVTAHEPMARPKGLDWDEQLAGQNADLDTFIGYFDGYNVRFLSGHTHNLFNRKWTSSFTEHNSGAICASWWWSGYHTPGIHIAQDGAPGGWTEWTIKGTECTHYYQAALQSPDYQFRAYDMNKVKEVITEDRSDAEGYPKYYNHIQSYGSNVILVNVWDYDDDWKVEISEDGTPLQVSEVGVYDPLHIEAMTIPRLNKNDGTTTFSTAKWRHFFKATASAPDTPVTVTVTDRYGKVYTEEMTRPKEFRTSDYQNEFVRLRPEAEFVHGSSSTLVFGWTTGGTAAEDAEVPYRIELFRDAACTDLVVSHEIPKQASCWTGKNLRFSFGGLQPATNYWFKVTNTENGDVSDVVEGKTSAFNVVDASTVTNAGVGDIILAEDLSEICWGPDELAGAAGFLPSPKTLDVPSGVSPSGNFVKYDDTGNRIFGTGIKLGDSRLSHGWGFHGNSSTYLRNAYLRMGATGGRTHMVTPLLSGIPEGKLATIEVTVTASKYDSGTELAVFAEKGLTVNSTTDAGNSSYKKYSGASLSGGYPLDISAVKTWGETKTVTIPNVDSDCRLLIGSLEDNNGKNRFYFFDVTVKIVALEAVPNRSVKVSIIGDSISTYQGWCDTSKGGAYYPKSNCDVDDVSKTWWYRLIYDKMSYGKFEKNISAGNTTIVQNTTGDSSAYWYGWDFCTRLKKLGLGDPDVVFIHGGTNDYGHTLYNNTSEELIDGLAMSSETFPDSFKSDLTDLLEEGDLATSVDEADALDGKTFAAAYIRLIRMLQTRYPSVKIVCVIGDYVQLGMGEAIRLIADHYDSVRVADLLDEYGFHASSSIPKYDYAHPNATGMNVMANYIYSQVGSWIDVP